MHQNGNDTPMIFGKLQTDFEDKINVPWNNERIGISNNAFSKPLSTSWKPRSEENVLIWTYMRRFQLSEVVGPQRERAKNNQRLPLLLFYLRNHPRPPGDEVKGFVDYLADSVIASKHPASLGRSGSLVRSFGGRAYVDCIFICFLYHESTTSFAVSNGYTGRENAEFAFP